MPPKERPKLLTLYVNGSKYVEKNPDPEVTLLSWLRKSLSLTGTKEGCQEGSCGACTVMVSRYDRRAEKIRHSCVVACMVPVVALHGQAVTTIEGIGSHLPQSIKLHPVQEKLLEVSGVGCGFCSPGMIMVMYTLLRNNPSPTADDIRLAFQGCYCRCTGYRAMMHGFESFSEGDCCQGSDSECCRTAKSTNTSCIAKNQKADSPYDPTQEPIFPPALQLNSSYSESIMFEGPNVTWFSPATLGEVLDILETHPKAAISTGGTIIKFLMAAAPHSVRYIISLRNVTELQNVEMRDDGLLVGAMVTVTELWEQLKEIVDKLLPEEKLRIIEVLLKNMSRFANWQNRNIATLIGNIASGVPSMDFMTWLSAAGCTVHVSSKDGITTMPLDDSFYTGGMPPTRLQPGSVITGITLPFTDQDTYFNLYKQNKRKENDSAIVGASMSVTFHEGTNVVKTLKLSFGTLGAKLQVPKKTCENAKGSNRPMNVSEILGICSVHCNLQDTGKNKSPLGKWDEQFVMDVWQGLKEELVVSADDGLGPVPYRKTLAISFFYKFYLSVLSQLHQRWTNVEGPPTNEQSTIDDLPDHPLQTNYDFNGQDASPVPQDVSRDLLNCVTGVENYTSDQPPYSGEQYIGLVLSKRPHAKITSVDATAALQLQGVSCYLDHKDIVDNRSGLVSLDEEIFVSEEVTCEGQTIGVIVAENRKTAAKAAKMVKVEYEDLQHVLTIDDVLATCPSTKPNFSSNQGNLSEGFTNSDVVLEGEIRIAGQEHCALETNCAVAVTQNETHLEIDATTELPSYAKKCISRAVGIPEERVKIKTGRLGGSYGGKLTRNISNLCVPVALASFRCKKVVRMVLTREEEFITTGRREGYLMKYKVGVSNSGSIQALDCVVYGNAGYSMDLSQLIMSDLVHRLGNCYNIPSYSVQGFCLRTNTKSTTFFQGCGNLEAVMMMEGIVSHIADKFGMKRTQVQNVNVNQGPSEKCMETCLSRSDYESRRREVDQYNTDNKWKKKGLASTPVKVPIDWEQRQEQLDGLVAGSFDLAQLDQCGEHVHLFGTSCSEVEIDCLTGEQKIVRTDLVLDVGSTTIDPALLVQVEGAFTMGVGAMLFEEPVYTANGTLHSNIFLFYKIPSIFSIPQCLNIHTLRNKTVTSATNEDLMNLGVSVSTSVFYALKDAVTAARIQNGLDPYYPLSSPATTERIRMACGDFLVQKVDDDYESGKAGFDSTGATTVFV